MFREADGGPRLLLVGHLGGRNVGDNAMLTGLIEGMTGSRPAVRILAKDPEAVTGLPASGIDVRRARLLPLLGGLTWASHLVFVGGTHFHDDYRPERFRRHVIYMARFVAVSLLARLMGRRVCWVAQGIGPILRPVTACLFRIGIRAASVVSVRDPASHEELRRFSGKDAHVAPDPAFLLGSEQALVGLPASSTTGIVVGVAPVSMRHSFGGTANLDDFVVAALAQALAMAHNAGLLDAVQVFVFRGGLREPDLPIAIRLLTALRAQSVPAQIAPYHDDSREVLRQISQCSAVLAMRYHAGVLAVAAQRPVVLLAYHRKVRDFASYLGLDDRAVLDPRAEFSAQTVYEAIVHLMKEGKSLPKREVEELSIRARDHSRLMLESSL